MTLRRLASLAVAALIAGTPLCARATHPEEPRARPTPAWLATQLLPSPEIAGGPLGARFGLRWQVTPLLYSWGVHRKLWPWRLFVVEPNVRQGGSIEVSFSPELFFGTDPWLLLRPSVRAYFPVIERGEWLSLSAGTSYQRVLGRDSAMVEIGAYALFGIVGIQLGYAPGPSQPIATLATLRLRYF